MTNLIEQMRIRILTSVMIDLMICDLENWDKKAYIDGLKEALDKFEVNT